MRAVIITSIVVLFGTCADAAADCLFDLDGDTMRLTGDCTTDTTIQIPDGMTLDGAHYTITAVDPAGGSFRGAVIATTGRTASVIDTAVTAAALASACETGAARLRGILFDGASGAIRGNIVTGINRGASACQEGNAIEVRNCGADEDRVAVEIHDNQVDAYQKAGVVVSCRVDAWIDKNEIGASADQDYLAANAVQVGFGAWASIERNRIAGNSSSSSSAAASAVLLFMTADGTTVRHNEIGGNADVAIFVRADGALIDGNRIFESGPDGFFDIGIGSYDSSGLDYGDSVVVNNHVEGYDIPYDVRGGRQAVQDGVQVE